MEKQKKSSNTDEKKINKGTTNSANSLKRNNYYCNIVTFKQDLNKQNKISKKIADEEYLRVLKGHQDPRKIDLNVSLEILNSVDKLVHQKIRPMSVEPNQRLSFENWKKFKNTERKLRRYYLKKKIEECNTEECKSINNKFGKESIEDASSTMFQT